jgi:CheY-like chemotaxis protein
MTGMKKSILHVEDDPSLQNLVRIALEQLGGYEVRTTANGHDALQLAWAAVPALVLLDLDLPGINGIETLRSLRCIPGVERVPAVFLTAAVDPAVEAELRFLGASEVLRKPFRPRLLVQAIARILAEAGP